MKTEYRIQNSKISKQQKKSLLVLIKAGELKRKETLKFLSSSFELGVLSFNGTLFPDSLKPVLWFGDNNNLRSRKKRLMQKTIINILSTNLAEGV